MSLRALCLALALLPGALASAGCGGGDDDARVKAEPPETSTTEATTATTVDEAAAAEADILAAYEGQWEDYRRAGDPPTADAPYLADHQTGRLLQASRNLLEKYAAEGVAVRGTYEADAEVVKVTGDKAQVEDCAVDGLEIVQMSTGTVVKPGATEPSGFRADVVREDGSWKVENLERDGEVCKR